MGGTEFTPAEGYYSNDWFIPPWATWHTIDGKGYTSIPIDAKSWYYMKWPDIRYYHYSDSLEPVLQLMKEYNPKDAVPVWIEAYTRDGKIQ